jgi:hypothetical protein
MSELPPWEDDDDGRPAITQTVEGMEFVWDGARWRRLQTIDQILDPPQTH